MISTEIKLGALKYKKKDGTTSQKLLRFYMISNYNFINFVLLHCYYTFWYDKKSLIRKLKLKIVSVQ